MKVSFSEALTPKAGALVVFVHEGRKLSKAAQEVDAQTGGQLSKAVKAAVKFTGKKDEYLEILAPGGLEVERVVLAGAGRKMDLLDWEAVGGSLFGRLNASGDKEASILFDEDEDGADVKAAHLAVGLRLKSYRFDHYFTKAKADQKPALKKLSVRVKEAASAKRHFAVLDAVADGVFLTRDLVTEPPNVLYPETFADRARELEKLGLEVEVLDEKKMRKLGMHSLLGVGQGSEKESFLVVMRWNGAAKNDQPVAFVGKGVTFDTGGISLKPGPGMEEMKWDMGGAGVVTGLMKALAGRKAKVNAVGVIGLVENMPDGNAQRPGDIVKSMSGQTIEIHNTDAEGRLVLADALWYTQDKYKPRYMIDLATLTGAMIISLGHEYAGFFSNNDRLSNELFKAGTATGEKVWRMPLHDAYDKQLKSDCADMKNIGGKAAGSITAAQFLQRFIGDTPWAHIDIAGVAWSHKDHPTAPKGATGFGVRLLDRFVSDHCEK